MKWTRITPQEARQWKKAAVRLARAVVRFQNDDFQRVHTDSTVNFAFQIIKLDKQSKI
jgi:hypothetical protein